MTDTATKPKTGALDVSLHVSTQNNFRRAMSTRKLVNNRHDDLLRSGSTHQLLNRPFGSSQPMSGPLFEAGNRPGAAESLATEETADDLSESGSDFSGDSFGEAEEDSPADREYLRKDLGASLHDDELEFNSGDEAGGADDLIDDVKARMKIDAKKEAES